jgi:hypothetical protein
MKKKTHEEMTSLSSLRKSGQWSRAEPAAPRSLAQCCEAPKAILVQREVALLWWREAMTGPRRINGRKPPPFSIRRCLRRNF